MSWICKKCETENPDKLDVCEVCDAQAPRIIDFSYDKILTGESVTVRWIAEYCDIVSIVYGGEQIEVTGKDSFDIETPGETDIAFLLSNADTTTRTQCFTMEFLEEPIINFNADKPKLRRGKDSSVFLSWNIKNVSSSVLKYGDNSISIGENGEITIEQNDNTNYFIEVVALDGKTVFSKELAINVFDECEIDFTADKYYIFPTIPVTLTWIVKNAKKVWLDKEDVEATGTKVIEPEKAVTIVLSAEDEFGVKEKQIDIGMLPIPQVKALLVPTPNIVSNMSLTIKQPKYNVDVKFPSIDIDWIKAEVPRVKSLTELGLFRKLSPPLPSTGFSLWRAIKRVYNHLIRK